MPTVKKSTKKSSKKKVPKNISQGVKRNQKKKVPKKVGRPKNCGRCKKNKNECKCGRPTVMTPEAIDKLKTAFMMGCSNEEAVLFAGINRTSLYNYEKENPQFVDEKEILRQRPKLKARMNVIKSIENESVDDSKWYLERKLKGEFSTRSELTGAGGKGLLDDKIEKMTLDEVREHVQSALALYNNIRSTDDE